MVFGQPEPLTVARMISTIGGGGERVVEEREIAGGRREAVVQIGHSYICKVMSCVGLVS